MTDSTLLTKRDRIYRAGFYFAVAILYVILLVPFNPMSYLPNTVVGEIATFLMGLPALILPENWRISASAEFKAVYLNPGFYCGVLIGYRRVTTLKQVWLGLIPVGILISPSFLALLVPQGIWFFLAFVPMLLATAFPYSLLGAFVGWKLRTRTKAGTPASAICLIALGPLFSPASLQAYGPTIGHRTIASRGEILLRQDFPDEYLEVNRYIASVMNGAEREDGIIEGDTYGVRGPWHFHNPYSTRASKGLKTEGLFQMRDGIEVVAVGRWEEALAAYNNGDKEKAYTLLGHVAHLATGDMFQPAHVHDDPHAGHNVGGDLETIESRYDSNPNVAVANGGLLSPIAVPLTSQGVVAFCDTAARITYSGSIFNGTLSDLASAHDGDLVGTISVGNDSLPIKFIKGEASSLEPDLRHDHLLIVQQNLLYDFSIPGDIGIFFGGVSRDQDWWELRDDNTGGVRKFYIDQYNRVTRNGQRLDDYFIAQFVPLAIRYTGGLLKAGAQGFDPIKPSVVLRQTDSDGAVIPEGGYAGGAIFIRAVDPTSEELDPSDHSHRVASGIYKIELRKGAQTIPIPLVEQGRAQVYRPYPNLPGENKLAGGDYELRVYDGTGNVARFAFKVADTPPNLTLINADGEFLDHGAVSENAIITSFASHNPAPVHKLEFFVGNVLSETVLAPDGTLDMRAYREFSPRSWHYVRACDVGSNCVYSLFGVFSPDETPPPPPGPPTACRGCTQRPSPRPGQPLPPPDDPNNPPPPPDPIPPRKPEPPVCRGEKCLDEPPAPEPLWVLKPKFPKFCARTPQNCLIPVAFPHDPNAKYGPAGPVSPGQAMTYTIEFENEGQGLALETFVRDTLDPSLDATNLVLRDMQSVNYLTETAVPAVFPWAYDARTRMLTVQTGDAGARQGGRFVVEARLKPDSVPGTIITNQAVVHFPNALEVTPTNVIVSAISLPTELVYEGASSATYLATSWFTAQLTASGKPVPAQPVEFSLAGSSWTVMTDAAGRVSVSTALAVLPGTYTLQARYAGDGLLYSPRETNIDFVVAKKPVRLDAPLAAARSTETASFVINITDEDGRPLSAQAEDPKTIHLELLDGNAITPLASTLLAGSSVSFEIALPQPLRISWSVRARFNGDLRYAAVASSGVLRLIDHSPPVISNLSPSGGQRYFASQAIPINFSVQDGEDPAPSATASLISHSGQSVTASNGGSIAASSLSPGLWTLLIDATDWAGNQTQAQGASFEVLAVTDNLAPRTSLSAGQPQSGTDPLFIASTTAVGFTSSDDLTTIGDGIGSGVQRTEYALDSGSSTLFAGDFTVSTEGPHSLVFFSADYAGNVEAAQSRALFVDVTPPLTRLLVDGLPAATTSFSVAPTAPLSFSAEDAGSGVAMTLYAVDGATSSSVTASTFTLSIGAHALAFHSVDNLGNEEVESRILVTVRPQDAVAPVVSLNYPGSAGAGVEQAVGGRVDVRGSVSDEHPGTWTLESAPGTGASAGFTTIAAGLGNVSGLIATWDTAGLTGYQTLRLSSTDAFGNTASITATIFVGNPVFNFAIGRKDSHVIVNKIRNPTGIAVRSDGNIWVASTDADELLLLAPSGVVVAEVGGRFGNSHGHGRGHDDEENNERGFENPQGLALDASDYVYLADKGNDRIVKLSADGSQVLLQIAKLDNHGRPKPGSDAGELRQPQDVVVDQNGDIYVADSGNRRIQVFSATGAFLRQFGPGVLLSTSEVRGITLTSEGLWVSDKELQVIHLFSRMGALIKTIGDADSVIGEISRMRGLASDRLGALYVVEPNRDRAQKFDPQGRGLLSFGSKAGLSHADKHAKRYLTMPIDAAVAPDGAIWITDTGRDRIVRYALPTSGGYGVAAYSAGGGESSSSSIEPAKRVVDHKDGAKVERDDGAGVTVPKGALAADLEITVEKGDENQDKEQKDAKRLAIKIKAVSEEVQYGPEGTTFSSPVTLTIPYDANLVASQGMKEDDLKVYYWNPTLKDWQVMPSSVDKAAKTVNAQTSHFSAYQVGALGGIGVAAIDDFGLRDGYVFPNPSRNGSALTFRMQPGSADSIEVRVYDLAGRKVHSSSDFRFRGALDDGNGKGAQNTYDHVWDVSGIGSGVYTFVMTAKKAGQPDIRKTGKIGIVK